MPDGALPKKRPGPSAAKKASDARVAELAERIKTAIDEYNEEADGQLSDWDVVSALLQVVSAEAREVQDCQ